MTATNYKIVIFKLQYSFKRILQTHKSFKIGQIYNNLSFYCCLTTVVEPSQTKPSNSLNNAYVVRKLQFYCLQYLIPGLSVHGH